MRIALVSMPDVAPVIMHESAFHMPNLGLASLAANVDDGHAVRIIDLIRSMAEAGKCVCAICAAPMVLAKAGLLEGKRVTAYPGVLDSVEVAGMAYTGAPVERDGAIITSRGPGTAMDFALELIDYLEGAEKRQTVEQSLVRP